MHVLIAPDCFTGTLTSPQAAAAVAEGWAEAAPDDVLEPCPLSDGGPGFLDVLHASLGGELLSATVPGPLGDDVPAAVLLVDTSDGSGAGTTAYVESAQACGLHLVPPARRDATRASTVGVGHLLRAALDAGPRRVVVGLGGSATTDGGAGMLAALGAGPADVLGRGGTALAAADAGALAGLPDVRSAFEGVDLVVASDVDVPLLGFHGAAASFAQQKGATPEQAQELGTALGVFAQAGLDALGPDAAPQRLVATPGSGAAGGLGFGLLLLGARREPGAQVVLDAVGFAGRLARSDLVVTGEGCLDWQSLRGKVVAGVAREALAAGVPAIALAGQVQAGRRELLSVGIEAAYPVAETPEQVSASLADPAGTLALRARRVARTWSRRP